VSRETEHLYVHHVYIPKIVVVAVCFNSRYISFTAQQSIIQLNNLLTFDIVQQVKTIITHKRVTVTIVSIFVILIASVAPVYYCNKLALTFSIYRNKTVVGLIFTDDREEVEAINFSVNNVFVQLTAFLALTILTFVLVFKLKQTTKWRKLTTVNSQTENFSTRDQKVTKMIVTISSFFIICFTPVCLITLCIILQPEFSLKGKCRNLFVTLASFGLVLESINSSMNIFIYFHMSSKFRNVLQEMFTIKR
jgi:hypothetical protein